MDSAGSNWAAPTSTNDRRSFTAFPLNANEAEVLQQVKDRRRLENHLVSAGRQLLGRRPARAFVAARAPSRPPSRSDSRELASRATPSAVPARAMASIAASAVTASADMPAEFANAVATAACCSSRPPPGHRRRRRSPAPARPGQPGRRAAVASSTGGSGCAGAGGASPGHCGSGGLSRAAATVARPAPRSPSVSTMVVAPAAVRPSACSRSRTDVVASATFWWMYELANRVSARSVLSTTTSASAAGLCRLSTRSSTCAADVASLIRAPPPARW